MESPMQPKTTPLDTSRLSSPPAASVPSGVEQHTTDEADRTTPAAPVKPLTDDELPALKNDIVAALCTCFDPEIPVNIYELGLIYDITIDPLGAVAIRMTLTSPMCPAAGTLRGDVQRKVQAVAKIPSVKVDVVWEPTGDNA